MLVDIIVRRTLVHAHDQPDASVSLPGGDPFRLLRADGQPEQRVLRLAQEGLILGEVQGGAVHVRGKLFPFLHEGAGRDVIPGPGRDDREFLSGGRTADAVGYGSGILHELPGFFEADGEDMAADTVGSGHHEGLCKSWRAWSSVRASSMRKPPVRVRQRASRWAPVPSASPRSRANARI